MNQKKNVYTCNEYRSEMRLLGLNRRLSDTRLTEEERKMLKREIKKLEASMGMD